ncbi:MAG: bile acid:sodium symporter family protein [Caldisericia bacterium]
MKKFIEKNSSYLLILVVFIGIFFPYFVFFTKYITYFLMTILFITFLKVDFNCIKIYIKKPMLIIYIIIINSLITPLLIYLIYKNFNFDYLTLSAIMLLALVPTGVAASAMTDLSNGNTLLTVLLTIITHILAPFLIPLFFYLFFRKVVKLDYFQVFITIFRLIFIPLLIAIPFKKFFKREANFLSNNSKIITLILVILLSLSIISLNANYMRENPFEVIKYILILYSVFILFQLINFFFPFFLKLPDKIAISNAKTFNNIAIATVLSIQFLDPKSSLIVILGQIPWPTMLIPLNIILFFVKKFHK